MKKGLKIAGTVAGIAALASLLPYAIKRDQENDETTVQALLWKYTNKPDHETPGKRTHILTPGFHNPFQADNDDLLMDDDYDDPILDCTPVPEDAPVEDEPVVTEDECIPF